MDKIMIIAGKEFREAWKNKVFIIISALFLVFSILSVYIGSSTKHAEMQAYLQTIELLKSQGTTVFPAKPVIFPMAILQNNIVYVTMVGALMAIFLGFDAMTKEKEFGNLKLLLSRPVFRDQLLTGKILGGGYVLGALQLCILVFEIILLALVGKFAPGISEILRLVIFTLVSFIYLMLFYMVSLLGSILMETGETVFLAGVTFWIAVSFVIPQLAATQRLFAYNTNLTAQSIVQVPQDTVTSQIIEIFSPTVHFEHIGKNLLQVMPETAQTAISSVLNGLMSDMALLLIPLIIVLCCSYWSMLRCEVNNHA
jgi:ABC-2 type transport system permease protein